MQLIFAAKNPCFDVLAYRDEQYNARKAVLDCMAAMDQELGLIWMGKALWAFLDASVLYRPRPPRVRSCGGGCRVRSQDVGSKLNISPRTG
jgi:hypothetical protein